MIKNLLSIAGSDPSGGAGIQADLKSFSARETYGMSVITALTAQNTKGVTGIHIPDSQFISQQLETIFDDIQVHGIKIGMIANRSIAQAISDKLQHLSNIPIVLDPVMFAKGGAKLLEDSAIDIIRTQLAPLATIITPNLPEAAALLKTSVAKDRFDMVAQAKALLEQGVKHVLLKGGHLDSNDSPDLLATRDGITWIEGERFQSRNTHGTGCSLSSALAAELAKGHTVKTATITAKQWLYGAISNNDKLTVGTGHGPVHHFHNHWQNEA